MSMKYLEHQDVALHPRPQEARPSNEPRAGWGDIHQKAVKHSTLIISVNDFIRSHLC